MPFVVSGEPSYDRQEGGKMARRLTRSSMVMNLPSEDASSLPSRPKLSRSPMLIPSPSRDHVIYSVHSSNDRRNPLIIKDGQKPKLGARLAEAAGQKAAEFTAIACCFPCGVAHLLYAAAIKMPAAMFRRMLRAAGRKNPSIGYTKMRGRFVQRRVGRFGFNDDDDDDFRRHHGSRWVVLPKEDDDDDWLMKTDESPELVALEKEMSMFFSSAGFWRSPSKKEW